MAVARDELAHDGVGAAEDGAGCEGAELGVGCEDGAGEGLVFCVGGMGPEA